MGKKRRKIHIRERVAGALDLPLDVVCDIARMTILSNRQILLENYESLYLYSENEITLTVEKRMLTILGEDLKIFGACDSRMIISGIIKEIKYTD